MRFRRITLPLLAPALTVNLTLTLVYGLGVFDQVIALTNGGPDNAFVRSLAEHRTGFETQLSAIGSTIGGAPVLPIIVALVAIVAAVGRHWRVAAFAILSQLVGLMVNSCFDSSSAIERMLSCAPPKTSGIGSETAVTWAVSGLTCKATLTTTVPRSNGPAVAGVTTARERGAPW